MLLHYVGSKLYNLDECHLVSIQSQRSIRLIMANQLLLSFALCIYFFGGSSGLGDAPKLTQHDSIPCVLYNSTVKKFSADIWLVRDDYSNCFETDGELKVCVHIN